MRLFVALDLPHPILATLDALLAKLMPAAPLQWSPLANLHVTTKFIGDVAADRLPDLKLALREVRGGPMPIRMHGLGWFPNPHAPRVLWAGVRGGEPLQELARKTDRATSAVGVAPPESRDFHPHLTLARIKTPALLAALRQVIAQLESVEFGEWEARSHCLYLSQNSRYTKLEEFPL